jgi:hypothetical protein
MEAQTQLIEQMPFFWGISFSINVTVGVTMFVSVMRQQMPPWATGVGTWIAWWAFTTAISLIINLINGSGAPFSYHQMGILTETMTNLGILFWVAIFTRNNAGLNGSDWVRMEAFRRQIVNEQVQKNENK